MNKKDQRKVRIQFLRINRCKMFWFEFLSEILKWSGAKETNVKIHKNSTISKEEILTKFNSQKTVTIANPN
jgi:hypothetical protein